MIRWASSAAERLVVIVEILDVDVDGRGHPKVLTAGGPNGVADLLAELRQVGHGEVGGDPAGDGLRNPQASVAPLEGACSKVERRRAPRARRPRCGG